MTEASPKRDDQVYVSIGHMVDYHAEIVLLTIPVPAQNAIELGFALAKQAVRETHSDPKILSAHCFEVYRVVGKEVGERTRYSKENLKEKVYFGSIEAVSDEWKRAFPDVTHAFRTETGSQIPLKPGEEVFDPNTFERVFPEPS